MQNTTVWLLNGVCVCVLAPENTTNANLCKPAHPRFSARIQREDCSTEFQLQVYIKAGVCVCVCVCVCVIITHRLLGRECEQVLQQSQHCYATHLKWPAISSAYPHTCFPVPHTHTHTHTCYAAHYHTVSQASPWQHHRHALSVGTRIKKTPRPLDLRSMQVQRSCIHRWIRFSQLGVSGCVYVCERMTAGVRVQRPAVLIKLIIAIMLLFPELVWWQHSSIIKQQLYGDKSRGHVIERLCCLSDGKRSLMAL